MSERPGGIGLLGRGHKPQFTERITMDARELQKLIEAARGQYTPGAPMDAATDQDILVGLLDGLGGDNPTPNDSPAWAAGIRIGNALRKALR